MSGWWRRLVAQLVGRELPAGFSGTLATDELVLAVAELRDGGYLVATSLGLWVPEGSSSRRMAWHLLSKVTWSGGVLAVTEAEETGAMRGAVLLADRPTRRYRLAASLGLAEAVQAKVTSSIKSRHHRDLPGGGVWFVQRKVAGRSGIVLQVRADPGTDPDALRAVTAQVADRFRELHESG